MIHNVPRTANVIARENIEVLVVDPPTCFRIFPEEINREYNLMLENMRYWDSIQIPSGLSPTCMVLTTLSQFVSTLEKPPLNNVYNIIVILYIDIVNSEVLSLLG